MNYLESFTRLRASRVPDPYDPDATVDDWAAPIELALAGYFEAGSSTEQIDPVRAQVITISTLVIADPDADVRRGDAWPPSSTEFRAMCLGIPAFAELRYETLHPEMPRTSFGMQWWQYVDAFALRQASAAEADRMRRDAYELTRQFVLAGNDLPAVPPALQKPEAPAKRFASDEAAQEHVRGIMDTINRLDAQDAEKTAAKQVADEKSDEPDR